MPKITAVRAIIDAIERSISPEIIINVKIIAIRPYSTYGVAESIINARSAKKGESCNEAIIDIINKITATHSGLTIQYLSVGFSLKYIEILLNIFYPTELFHSINN